LARRKTNADDPIDPKEEPSRKEAIFSPHPDGYYQYGGNFMIVNNSYIAY
jgi:hypothetical protein